MPAKISRLNISPQGICSSLLEEMKSLIVWSKVPLQVEVSSLTFTSHLLTNQQRKISFFVWGLWGTFIVGRGLKCLAQQSAVISICGFRSALYSSPVLWYMCLFWTSLELVMFIVILMQKLTCWSKRQTYITVWCPHAVNIKCILITLVLCSAWIITPYWFLCVNSQITFLLQLDCSSI